MHSHSGEDEAVLVGLVVGRQIVEVQHANLEYGVVRADAEIGYSQTRYHLQSRDSLSHVQNDMH